MFYGSAIEAKAKIRRRLRENLSKNVLSKPSNDIHRVVKLVIRRYIDDI